eukprot:13096964-Ditylum_brightwellii.AAC.1
MDNGLVLLVSTLHTVGKSIKVNRRKPCITLKNKGHVEKVWGKVHRVENLIPLLVTTTTSGWEEWILLISEQQ